jgi:hypothetical protein
VFSYLAFIAFVGNLLVAGLNTVAVLFPAFGFLLVVGYLVTNFDLSCFVSLVEITAYLAILSCL